MCKPGGNTQTTTSTSQPPPQVMQAYSDAYSRAQDAANRPYQPYTGQTVAPLTSQQEAAIGLSTTSAANWNPYANAANDYLTAATQPLYDTVSQYESPYTNDVVNATQAQFNNQNAIQQQGVIGNAVSQGAWGGDRSAVAQGIVAGQQQLAQAPVLAGLRNTGYQTALNANEAGNWLNSQAAGQESALGQANFGVDQATLNQMMQFGTVGQQQAQAYLNAPYYQYQASQAYPFQTAGFLANVAEGLGSGAGGTSSTSAPGPSTLSQVGGLGLGAAGIVGATGGFGSNGWLSGMVGGGSATGGLYRRGGIVSYAPGGGIAPPMGGSGMPFGAGSPFGVTMPDFSVSVVPTGQGGKPTGQFSPMGGNGQTSTTTGGGGAGGILGSLGALASIGRFALALERGGAVPRFDTGGGIMGNMLPYQGDGAGIVPNIRMAHGSMGPPHAPGAAQQPQGLDTSLTGLINIGKATGAFGKNGWLSNLRGGGIDDPAAQYRRGGGIVGHYDDGGGVGLDDDDDYGGGGDLIIAPASPTRNSFLENSGAVPAGSTAAVPDTSMGIAGVPMDLPPVQVEGGIAPAPATGGRSGVPAETAAALVKKYESNGGDYNVGFGGADLSNAPLDANGFPQWAGKTGPAGMSHAAGAYQFEPATWAKYAAQLGIKDFSPASQDAVFRAAYADQGMSPWAPYNSRLRAALGGGDTTATESYGPSTGGGIAPPPNAGGDDGGVGMGIVPRATAAAPADSDSMAGLKTPGVNPWLALAAAGFGMAAGRSPNALQNIGAGGLEGIKMLESQRQSLPETRLKTAQAQAAEMEVSRITAYRNYIAGKTKNPQAGVDLIDHRLNTAHNDVANSGETAAVPVPGGSVAPLAAPANPVPGAGGDTVAVAPAAAGAAAAHVPAMTPEEQRVSVELRTQMADIDKRMRDQQDFAALSKTPEDFLHAQQAINQLAIRRSELLEKLPEYVRSNAYGKVAAENPGLIARAGAEEAAKNAPLVARKQGEVGVEPQSYLTASGETATAPRAQVIAGTAPGMQPPAGGQPATPDGKYDPTPTSLMRPTPGVAVTELPTHIKEKLSADQKELEEYGQKAQLAPTTLARTHQLSDILQQYQTGAFAQSGYALAKYAAAVGLPVPQNWNPANPEEFNKLATSLVFEQLKAIGGRPMIAEIAGLQQTNPNISLRPEANLAIISNIASEAKVANDRFQNATSVWNKYHQLGDFDAKYVANSPVQGIYDSTRKILTDGVANGAANAQPPMPGAFKGGDNNWYVYQNGKPYRLTKKPAAQAPIAQP